MTSFTHQVECWSLWPTRGIEIGMRRRRRRRRKACNPTHLHGGVQHALAVSYSKMSILEIVIVTVIEAEMARKLCTEDKTSAPMPWRHNGWLGNKKLPNHGTQKVENALFNHAQAGNCHPSNIWVDANISIGGECLGFVTWAKTSNCESFYLILPTICKIASHYVVLNFFCFSKHNREVNENRAQSELDFTKQLGLNVLWPWDCKRHKWKKTIVW